MMDQLTAGTNHAKIAKIANSPIEDNVRFTMNDLIDFDSLDVDSDREENEKVRSMAPSPMEAAFHMASGVANMEEYRAADSSNDTLLDEAMNAAILNLPRMMEA